MDVAASLIAITGLAYSSSKALYDLIDGIREAPKLIAEINTDLSALQTVLKSLEETLKGGDSAVVSPVFGRVGVSKALDACSKICNDFLTTVQKYTKHSKGEEFSKRDRFIVTFRKSKIEAFTARLNVSKGTIELAVTSANLVTNTLTLKGTQELKTLLAKQEEEFQTQMKKLTDIETDLNDLVIPPDAEDPDNDIIPITSTERDLTLALLPTLRQVCEEAMEATKPEYLVKQVREGKIVTEKGSLAVAGIVGNVEGNVEQTQKGDMETRDKSIAVSGIMDGESFRAMFGKSFMGSDDDPKGSK